MKILLLLAILRAGPSVGLARLTSTGFPIIIDTVDVRLRISDTEGKSVKFRFIGVSPGVGIAPTLDLPGNFIMMNQTTWTTPATVHFTFHPYKYYSPGVSRMLLLHFTTVDEEPASTVTQVVDYRRFGLTRPEVRSVVNSYSLEPVLSPGALISIFDPALSSLATYGDIDIFGRYPTSLGRRSLQINGITAPVLSVVGDRINAIVPYEVAGQSTAAVVLVDDLGRSATAVFVQIRDTSPAILTDSATGKGQAATRQIVNQKWSLNSDDNPVPPGAAVELFCTGAGSWGRTLDSDIAFGDPYPPGGFSQGLGLWGLWNFVAKPITVTIGGRPARILYAGTAQYRPWGVLQVNAIVPEGIGSGPQLVVLKVGDNDNAQQRVTIVVQ